MRPPPAPLDWEYETIRDIPSFAHITMGTVAACGALVAIVMLLTGKI